MSYKPQHRKDASRGSRSLLSIDLFRSIGRSRSHSTSALGTTDSVLDLRAASALSCNPSQQAGPPRPGFVTPDLPPSSQTSAANSLRSVQFRSIRRAQTCTPERQIRAKKSRPLSWLPFHRSKQWQGSKSESMPLPHQTSMSSVAKSTIGTPILTSTTNARVADVENIECSDVLLPDYSSRVNGSTQNFHEPGSADAGSHRSFTSTFRSVKKRLGAHARRASTSLLTDKKSGARRGHSATPSAGSVKMMSSIQAFKDKLHHLPGRSSRTASAADLKQKAAEDPAQSVIDDEELDTIQPLQTIPRLPCLYTEGTTNLMATSLSRSFASAVEKLNFDPSPAAMHDTTPLQRLKKAKSLWSLNKFVRSVSNNTIDKGQSSSRSGSEEHSSSRQAPTNSTGPSTAQTSLSRDLLRNKPEPLKAVPLRWSARKNRYVKAKNQGRLPAIDPLRMHPDVMAFAVPPPQADTPSTPGPNQSHDRKSDDDGAESIDKAVIYSPSTGNLSLYSRTPSPKAEYAQVLRERIPQDTPTRKPRHKASGSMLRKSVSSFFGRSASAMRLSFTPSRKSRTEHDLSKATNRQSWPNAGANKKAGKRRGRSLSTPELYGPDGVRAAWDYQPSTPSPLRKSTRLSPKSNGRQRAVTSTTPVKVPMSGITLRHPRSTTFFSDPEKRYGRYIQDSV